jgi:hypothetical protein
MTDFDIQEKLIAHFNTLNLASGCAFLSDYSETTKEYGNVSYPNKPFDMPDDKRFFVLHFMPGEPDAVAIGEGSPTRWEGLFQIDIYVQKDYGEDEVKAKYDSIMELFKRGTFIDNTVDINKSYRLTPQEEIDAYKTVVRIEWTADI